MSRNQDTSSEVVEITLGGQQVIESRLSKLNPHQRVPDEVYLAGPEAVSMYIDFRARQAGQTPSPGFMERIDLATVA